MSALEKLSERDRKTLLFGAAATAAILLYFFAVEPLWNSYNTNKEEMPRVAEMTQRYRAALQNTGSRDKTSDFYEAEFNRLKEASIIDDTDALATGQLSELVRKNASSSGITLMSSTAERADAVPGFKVLNLSITFTSTLKNVAAFMGKMENAAKKIKIREVKIKSTKDNYGRYEPETLSVTMLISALRYIPPQQRDRGEKSPRT